MTNNQEINFAGYPCIPGAVKLHQMPQCSTNTDLIDLTNHDEFDFKNEAEIQRINSAYRPTQVHLYAAKVGVRTCNHEAAYKAAGEIEVNASS